MNRAEVINQLRATEYAGPVSYTKTRLEQMLAERQNIGWAVKAVKMVTGASGSKSSDGKYGGGPTPKSTLTLFSPDPDRGAVLACGHTAVGSIAALDDEVMCFGCKGRHAVTEAMVR